MDPLLGGSGFAPALSDCLNENIEMADCDKHTVSGDQYAAEPNDPIMASPRLIRVQNSPPHSARDPPVMALNDSGHTSESSNRNRAPLSRSKI